MHVLFFFDRLTGEGHLSQLMLILTMIPLYDGSSLDWRREIKSSLARGTLEMFDIGQHSYYILFDVSVCFFTLFQSFLLSRLEYYSFFLFKFMIPASDLATKLNWGMWNLFWVSVL